MSDEQVSPPLHPSLLDSPTDLAQLRRVLRERRKAVPKFASDAAALAIAQHLSRHRLLGRHQRIAVYSAFDGEIDLAHVIRQAQRLECTLYAPRIVNMRARRMEFIEFKRRDGQARNLFSIPEPRRQLHRRIDPRRIDVVFVPVVAFDAHGWRLGFGAGFYDRKFGFLRHGFKRKPALIGVGYEFQRLPRQTPRPWDVLLDFVVTERGMHRCHTLHSPFITTSS